MAMNWLTLEGKKYPHTLVHKAIENIKIENIKLAIKYKPYNLYFDSFLLRIWEEEMNQNLLHSQSTFRSYLQPICYSKILYLNKFKKLHHENKFQYLKQFHSKFICFKPFINSFVQLVIKLHIHKIYAWRFPLNISIQI